MSMARLGCLIGLSERTFNFRLQLVCRGLSRQNFYKLDCSYEKLICQAWKGGTRHGWSIECDRTLYKFEYYESGVKKLKISNGEVMVPGVIHILGGFYQHVWFVGILHIRAEIDRYEIEEPANYYWIPRAGKLYISALELLYEVLELPVVKRLVLKI